MSSPLNDSHLHIIEKAIADIQFGEVQIAIQNGKIVQINRLEKHRFSHKPETVTNKIIIK
ncbi:YezD family protein [Kurthia sibirica]|uniref:DUF2292 domain-containing protein n=1 Tax=Kurthia sibirica TaxID=202750 RepID=A0A2U3ALP0_9BACL|nr:YezD family protein [Kurthia sibirica]PWI25458.1 DUF2292 domain-containing protein [Kurthia sibirica]GEK34961.1 hypothetical protein KSI01_24940 [Kurthia sibirica]